MVPYNEKDEHYISIDTNQSYLINKIEFLSYIHEQCVYLLYIYSILGDIS